MRISDWSSDVCSSDLLRAVGAGERTLNLLGGDAERRRLVAVDVDDDARAGDGEIAGDVLEARHSAQLGLDDAGPFVQLVEVDVLQGVLVGRLRQPRADPARRRVLHEGAYHGPDRERLAQLLNDP